jgi:hypothetical protein
MRFGKRILVTLALMLAVLPVGASQAAVPAAPAWSISGASSPTNFSASTTFDTANGGPVYVVIARNVGNGPTNGSFVVSDTLPAGLLPSTKRQVRGHYGGTEGATTPLANCGFVGQIASCEGSTPALRPGEVLEMQVPVAVEVDASGSVTNEVAIAGGEAAAVRSVVTTPISEASAPFAFLSGREGFSTNATDVRGLPVTTAGAHPAELNVELGFPTYSAPENPNVPTARTLRATGGGLRDISTVLPPGVVANPLAAVRCTEVELEKEEHGATGCPSASQVGTIVLPVSLGVTPGPFVRAVYNMVAPSGSAGELAFEVVEGTYVHLLASVKSGGSYEIAAQASDVLAKVPVSGAQVHLWGSPSDASHDGAREPCLSSSDRTRNCEVPRTNLAFLTMPSACSGPLVSASTADSWLEPTAFKTASAVTTDAEGTPIGVGDCSSLAFEPSMTVEPESHSTDTPSGLAVGIHIPQGEEYESGGSEARSPSTLKDVTVTLPTGLTVNASAADGRQACAPGQIGLVTAVGQMPIRFDESPETCPNSSKVGTASVETPVLDHALPGAVYLAAPHANPFGTLLAVYLVVEDPATGIIAKLPGRVEADSKSGQLTATFAENPQLPIEDVHVEFFGGPRAALATGPVCGRYEANASLSPWSGNPASVIPLAFSLDHGTGSAPCAGSEGQLPNSPSFQAGTTSPVAGTYSPFVLHLTRSDGSQRVSALNVTMPLGLTGKLVGIPYCPESAIGAAERKAGVEEQASASCPAASEVGTVTVGAGVGQDPYFVTGRAYLAGPYKGAPLSLVIVTPAVAGPFDLGTVVVRSALFVDPLTAQITVKSDPLPTILQGIPLNVRSISVDINRSGFTLNPTSCESTAVGGEVVSTTGATAKVGAPFQPGGCARLAFKPKVTLSLKGATKRAGHPALKAVVTYPKQGLYANIARAQVSLPHSEFLDQGNLNRVCSQGDLKAGTCPAKSIYGKAKAWTPLLEKPLEGNVYLAVGFGYKLPALVAELNGQIRVLLKGKVDTDKQKGIRTTFESVPDAPVERFVLEMKGGAKYGLLENSENICRKAQKAGASFRAQNGLVKSLSTKIQNSCGSKKKSKHRGHKPKRAPKK